MVSWLNTDLSNVTGSEDPRLSSTISDLSSSVESRRLGHSLIVQVLIVYDSSRSKLSLLQELENQIENSRSKKKEIWRIPDNEGGNDDESVNDANHNAFRKSSNPTYMAIVQDRRGATAFVLCIEDAGIDEKTRIGTKIELLSSTQILRGIFSVKRKDIKILGGCDATLEANKGVLLREFLKNSLDSQSTS